MNNISDITQICVLGGGRWGSAMSIYLQKIGFEVTIYCHSVETKNFIKENNFSPYLIDYKFLEKLNVYTDINKAVKGIKIIFIAIPTRYIKSELLKIDNIDSDTIIIGISKGIDIDSLKSVSEIILDIFPKNNIMQLGGPCFPNGLLNEGSYSAETLAAKNLELSAKIQSRISTNNFRVYLSDDLSGVALVGAIKNVYAIAAGVIDGIGLNVEAKSVLITRGIHEIQKISQKLAIKKSTIYGLCGLGDLILTCYSGNQSYNYRFGYKIGKVKDVNLVLSDFKPSLPEGYYTTNALFKLSINENIDTPIIKSIYNFLYKNQDIDSILYQLMNRPLIFE